VGFRTERLVVAQGQRSQVVERSRHGAGRHHHQLDDLGRQVDSRRDEALGQALDVGHRQRVCATDCRCARED
jgi:hypothetical protein